MTNVRLLRTPAPGMISDPAGADEWLAHNRRAYELTYNRPAPAGWGVETARLLAEARRPPMAFGLAAIGEAGIGYELHVRAERLAAAGLAEEQIVVVLASEYANLTSENCYQNAAASACMARAKGRLPDPLGPNGAEIRAAADENNEPDARAIVAVGSVGDLVALLDAHDIRLRYERDAGGEWVRTTRAIVKGGPARRAIAALRAPLLASMRGGKADAGSALR